MDILKAYSQLNKALTKIREKDTTVEVIGLHNGGVLIHIPKSLLTSFRSINDLSYSLWDSGVRIVPKDAMFDLTTGKWKAPN